jgi:acyl-CoA synthetase (AMP-forming)/AMP-acid ligase II
MRRDIKTNLAQGQNLTHVFEANVQKHPDKIAMVKVGGRNWSFRQVDDYANQVANFFYEKGYRKGDVVAIMMDSCPEFVCLWLGMAKIGVRAALINFNLRQQTLAHCITVSKCKAYIFGSNYASGEISHPSCSNDIYSITSQHSRNRRTCFQMAVCRFIALAAKIQKPPSRSSI